MPKLIPLILLKKTKYDLKKAEDIVSLLLEEYPDYYQLYIISGNLKNNLEDPNGSQVMWEKALEIYPECFEALENLAFCLSFEALVFCRVVSAVPLENLDFCFSLENLAFCLVVCGLT